MFTTSFEDPDNFILELLMQVTWWPGWIVTVLLIGAGAARDRSDRQRPNANPASRGAALNTTTRPLNAIAPLGARRISLDALRAAARPDPAWPDLENSIAALETQPGGPPKVWFFADGLYGLAARRDGVMVLCRHGEVRRATPRATVVYDVDGNGNLVAVSIDGFELKDPRPEERVREFLHLAQARQRRVVAPELPPAQPPPAPALDNAPPTSPSRSAAAALNELEHLRGRGLVTDDEYAAKRRDILDRI